MKRKELTDDHETLTWRKQFYNWFIKYEECDNGCDNLFKQSSIAWGEYIDYSNQTNFAQGYKSFLDVIMEEIGDDIDIRTNYKVQNIDYSNEEYVQITALHNGILHFIQADHVISTVSLGSHYAPETFKM